MMHDEAFHAILEAKYARIIEAMSQQHDVSSKRLWTSSTTLHCCPSLKRVLQIFIVVVITIWPRKSGKSM